MTYYNARHGNGQTQTRSAADDVAHATQLPTSASHPFYRRLNELLREHGFDDFVEGQCASFYAETMGRPGLPPGIYFRLLFHDLETLEIRTYISEPDRGPQSRTDQHAQRDAV